MKTVERRHAGEIWHLQYQGMGQHCLRADNACAPTLLVPTLLVSTLGVPTLLVSTLLVPTLLVPTLLVPTLLVLIRFVRQH